MRGGLQTFTAFAVFTAIIFFSPVPANAQAGGTAAGKVPIGTTSVASQLGVMGGGVAIGSAYAPTITAPTDSLIVSGSVGIGSTSPGANLTITGTEALNFGTNYSTTGTSQNDVAINTASTVRYTGGGAATFNGIVAGVPGQLLYLHNGSTSALTLANQASADTTYANQIVTGTGGNLTVATNSEVTLQYDNTATNSSGATGAWRVVGGSGSGGSITGSGTSNYVARWTSSTALGTGALYDNGTQVGIGTATLANTLDVAGGVAIGTGYAGVTAAPTGGLIVVGSTAIGTSAPLALFETNAGNNTTQNETVYNSPSNSQVFVIGQDNEDLITAGTTTAVGTSTAAPTAVQYNQTIINPASAALGMTIYNHYNRMTQPATNTYNAGGLLVGTEDLVLDYVPTGTTTSGSLEGNITEALLEGAGTRSTLLGVEGLAGIVNYNSTNQASTAGTVYGGYFIAEDTSTGGTVANFYPLRSAISNSGAVTGSMYNLYATDSSSGAVTGNVVGIYNAISQTKTVGGAVYGLDMSVTISSTVTGVDYGIYNYVNMASSVGGSNYAYWSTDYNQSATTGSLYGSYTYLQNTGTVGDTSAGGGYTGIYNQLYNAGTIGTTTPSVSTNYGIYDYINNGGTINGPTYGLFINGFGTGGTWGSTTLYDIYAADSAASNYLAGNVGINTTSPANKLDVNGSLAVGTYAGTASGASNELIVSGGVGIGTTNPGTAALAVMNGNVGIGLTVPNQPLAIGQATVPTTITVTGTTSPAFAGTYTMSGTYGSRSYWQGSPGYIWWSGGNWFISAALGGTPNSFYYANSGSYPPSATSGWVAYAGASGSPTTSSSGSTTSNAYGSFTVDSSGNIITAGKASIGTMAAYSTVLTGGAVPNQTASYYMPAIGWQTGSLIDVGANVSSTSVQYIGLNLSNSSQVNNTYSPFITFSRLSDDGTYDNAFASIGAQRTGQGPGTLWNSGDLVFSTASTTSYVTEKMRIMSNGNVGIGTSSPTGILSFNVSSTDYGWLGAANGSGPTNKLVTQVTSGGSALEIYDQNGSSNTAYILNLTNNNGGTEVSKMAVTDAGNVGIGTAPANTLDVNGSLAVGSFAGTATGGSNELIVSGNVGVGLTAPNALLTVGRATVPTTITVSGSPTPSGLAGTYTMSGAYNGKSYWQSSGGSIWWVSGYWFVSPSLGVASNDFYYSSSAISPPSGSGWTPQSGASGSLTTAGSGSTTTNATGALTVDSSGDLTTTGMVSLGTPLMGSSAVLLQGGLVSGASYYTAFYNGMTNASPALVDIGTSITSTSSLVVGLNLENSAQTNNTFAPLIAFSGLSGNAGYNMPYATIGAQRTGASGSWNTGDIVFSTSASNYVTERMRLTSNGGLGIGVTTTANALDVNGSLAVGGFAGTAAGATNQLIVSGNVGIGVANPSQALSIGTLPAGSTITVGGSMTPNLAGSYTVAGTYGGKNYWQSSAGYIFWYSGYWTISTTLGTLGSPRRMLK